VSGAPRVSHRFAEVGGLRLHALELGGDGPAVECLHGVTGHAWMFRDVAAELGDAARVLAIDLRGHGDSQWSPDERYATDDHVADVAGVLTQLGLSGVTLVGASWGGLIGTRVAARHAELVGRLAVLDVEPSFGEPDTAVPARPADFGGHAEVVAWERAANPHAPSDLVEAVAAHGTRPGPGGRLVRKHDPFFLRRWPFRNEDHWSELAGLRIPLLVVRAEGGLLRPETAERMVAEARSARLVCIPRARHVVPVEAPGPLAAAIRALLEEPVPAPLEEVHGPR
jgi:pimeloyl-ACP methyl ester carboxylesterase